MTLARALRLDDDERTHLFALARLAPVKRRRQPKPEVASPGAQRLLHAMSDIPALVLGRRSDILAWNRAGHLLLAGHVDFTAPARPSERPNHIRMLFLDPHTRELHRDWDAEAALAVASLRYVAAQFPDDRRLAELVGHLDLHYEVLHLPDGDGQRLLTHTADPGSGSEAALRLLLDAR